MRYMLLIYSDEKHYETVSEEDMGKLMAGYGQFSAEYEAQIQGSERLQPIQTATTVRLRNGDAVTTDGPFAETKEQLGGYYVVEAKDLDEAIAMAAKIPTASYGSVEVRPIWEMEMEP
jgi:hypothetical protein